jgi:opacity protein-like surface antigen
MKYQFVFVFVLMLLTCAVYSSLAQQAILPAGAEAAGIGGSVSYSIGQVDFESNEHSSGYVQQGVQQPYRLTIQLNYFIQGYYTGNGMMASVLQNQGQANGIYDVDSVTIEIRQATSPFAVMDTYTGILQTNGTIHCTFPQAIEGHSYYLVLKHRNALETWSASPVVISAVSNYNFSMGQSQAYGNNMIAVDAGVWALYSGDLNADENIDLVDASILEIDINNFAIGYMASDINGDGNVDLLDNSIPEANINDFIYTIRP